MLRHDHLDLKERETLLPESAEPPVSPIELDTGIGVFRGLLYALPLALLVWIGIAALIYWW